jgi:hypothetical protein
MMYGKISSKNTRRWYNNYLYNVNQQHGDCIEQYINSDSTRIRFHDHLLTSPERYHELKSHRIIVLWVHVT